MSFEFYDGSGRRSDAPTVTVDKYARLYLNAAARELLGCNGIPAKLYVGYDKVNKRIGLAKPDVVRLTDKKPITFDAKRAYASARGFIRKFQIPHDKAYRYEYVGKENGVYVFELEGYDAPDSQYR